MAYVGTPTRYSDPVYTLASIIEGEAGGEGSRGMEAVGAVMVNRANRNFSGYGTDPVDQATARKQFQGQSKPSALALAVARQVINKTVPDRTGGAVYYAKPSDSTAKWAKRLDAQNSLKIGSHYFTDNTQGRPFKGGATGAQELPIPTLREGMRNSPDVRQAQEELQKAGFYVGQLDGDFGPQTKQAVRDYQLANGLKADGIIGPQTMAAMAGGGFDVAQLSASMQALGLPGVPPDVAASFAANTALRGSGPAGSPADTVTQLSASLQALGLPPVPTDVAAAYIGIQTPTPAALAVDAMARGEVPPVMPGSATIGAGSLATSGPIAMRSVEAAALPEHNPAVNPGLPVQPTTLAIQARQQADAIPAGPTVNPGKGAGYAPDTPLGLGNVLAEQVKGGDVSAAVQSMKDIWNDSAAGSSLRVLGQLPQFANDIAKNSPYVFEQLKSGDWKSDLPKDTDPRMVSAIDSAIKATALGFELPKLPEYTGPASVPMPNASPFRGQTGSAPPVAAPTPSPSRLASAGSDYAVLPALGYAQAPSTSAQMGYTAPTPNGLDLGVIQTAGQQAAGRPVSSVYSPAPSPAQKSYGPALLDKNAYDLAATGFKTNLPAGLTAQNIEAQPVNPAWQQWTKDVAAGLRDPIADPAPPKYLASPAAAPSLKVAPAPAVVKAAPRKAAPLAITVNARSALPYGQGYTGQPGGLGLYPASSMPGAGQLAVPAGAIYHAPSAGWNASTGQPSYDPGGGSVYAYTTSPGGQTTYQTNSGTTWTIDTNNQGPGSATASKVLCTYYSRIGWLPKAVWKADIRYSMTMVPPLVQSGYLWWAEPVVRYLGGKSLPARVLTHAMWPVVKGWAHEMAHRADPEQFPRGSVVGRIITLTLEPLCGVLGLLRNIRRPLEAQ